MSFESINLPNSRNRFFQFFATGAGHMAEQFNPGFSYELMDVRLILSVTHPSTEYFTVALSAAEGSAYNVRLMSLLASDLNNVTDEVWTPSAEKLLYRRDDTLNLSMLNSTGVVWGLVVTCWSVLE